MRRAEPLCVVQSSAASLGQSSIRVSDRLDFPTFAPLPSTSNYLQNGRSNYSLTPLVEDHAKSLNFFQGRVRTKTVKRASRVVIEKYYPRLTLDFHTNKQIMNEVAVIPSKRLRNKIAGFTTHLMKRIQKGPVPGISFKLQEEERERKVRQDAVFLLDGLGCDTERISRCSLTGQLRSRGLRSRHLRRSHRGRPRDQGTAQ
jgi:ribosomal protein S17E